MLTAEGQKQAAILKAEGESKAIATVFQAIHDGNPDQAAQLPVPADAPAAAPGDSNKVFVIPSEFSEAFGGIAKAFAQRARGVGSSVAVINSGPPASTPTGQPPTRRSRANVSRRCSTPS